MKRNTTMTHVERQTRQDRLAKFLEDLGHEFLQTKRLRYLNAEYTLPVNVGGGGFVVIATDGSRHALTGDHMTIMREMEYWAIVGRGDCPADGWRETLQRGVGSSERTPPAIAMLEREELGAADVADRIRALQRKIVLPKGERAKDLINAGRRS